MYQNYNYYPQQLQTQQVPQQQFAYQPQPYYRQAPPQVGLKGRLVSSLEEARATSIDFDGSVFYFPDLANKRIYTKQINIDGTASLYVYDLKNECLGACSECTRVHRTAVSTVKSCETVHWKHAPVRKCHTVDCLVEDTLSRDREWERCRELVLESE